MAEQQEQGEQGEQTQEAIAVALLRGLADKIDTNKGNGFAGAFAIVPPSGDVKELLLLNNTGDLAMFWSLLKSTAEMAINEIVEAERDQPRQWGSR